MNPTLPSTAEIEQCNTLLKEIKLATVEILNSHYDVVCVQDIINDMPREFFLKYSDIFNYDATDLWCVASPQHSELIRLDRYIQKYHNLLRHPSQLFSERRDMPDNTTWYQGLACDNHDLLLVFKSGFIESLEDILAYYRRHIVHIQICRERN